MTWSRLFVYGASGHGKVVADILLRSNTASFEGFIDDCESLVGTQLLDLPVVGTGRYLQEQAAKHNVAIALGIGDNTIRQKISERCQVLGIQLATAIHPKAVVAPSATIGIGTVVMAGAAINPDARIGAGVIVNTGAVVEHDVVIGDYAHLSPNAATGGGSSLGALSHLGLGAVILPLVSVGSSTIVGAGAVVNRDLPGGVVAVGVPARVHRTLVND